MTYIKMILNKALRLQGFSGDLMVSKPKKSGFGDYTSQVLLQNKLDGKLLMNELLKSQLIHSVEIVRGHLNIYLTETLINSKNELVEVTGFNRLQVIRDRLYDEGHTNGEVPEHFYPLVKKVNELFLSLDVLKDSDGLEKDLISLFKKLDLGYIYRSQSSQSLGGIYKLFNTCLLALERVNNE